MNKEEFMEKLSTIITHSIDEMYDKGDPRFILIVFPEDNLSNFDVMASIDQKDFVNFIDAAYNDLMRQRKPNTQH